MGRKVILSPRAIEDLAGIVSYIAQDSPDRAVAFGEALIARTQQIGEFPEAGRIVPEFRDPSVREIIHDPYRIVYRIARDGTTVEVARFWHAKRGHL